MAPCTHPGFCREVNGARRPHTCSKPCAFEEKKTYKKHENPAAPTTHHEIHSSPATATTSRRRVTKHVPHVSLHSPTSTYPGFVEIGLVQLSQSVKTTNVTHTHTDTQTDRQTNGTMYAPRYEEAFLTIKTNGQVASLRRPCSITGRDKSGKASSYLQQAVCVRRKNRKTKKPKNTRNKPRRTENLPRNPQQPGDRDHL